MNDEPKDEPNKSPGMPAAPSPSGFTRFIVVLLLLFAIGGFGCVTLCGAAFTLGSLDASGYESGMLVIALPSLLIGGALTWLCVRTLRRYLNRPRP